MFGTIRTILYNVKSGILQVQFIIKTCMIKSVIGGSNLDIMLFVQRITIYSNKKNIAE